MNVLKFIALYILVCGNISANTTTDSLLQKLDFELGRKSDYLAQKQARITILQKDIAEFESKNDSKQLFVLYDKMFSEYESFVYDSAFKYINKARNTAIGLHDPSKLIYSKIKLGFVLLSSGLFKEALDSLKQINIRNIPDSIKYHYYTFMARAYYDLADYDGDYYFAPMYRSIGVDYQDTASHYVLPNTSNYWYCQSLFRLKRLDYQGAREAFETWITKFKLSDHEYAIAASSLSYVYDMLKREDDAMDMIIRAAMADIRACTKETVAFRNLADLLFRKGEVKKAYLYIKQALDDASFYNARHRKIEIASILPIIEGEKLNTVEKQKTALETYAVLITLLILLVVAFLIIIFRQLRKLKQAKSLIQEININLTEANRKLQESNKIKEEYIGNIFTLTSDYLEKIENLKKDINRKLITGRTEELKLQLRNMDLKREREDYYHNFDRMFLKIFPDFVQEFNKLFEVKDQFQLKDEGLLNADLRIFALIRLGITDNEKIAKVLEYSVNTIYAYKTKIKNKSIVANEDFETKIMEIKSVRL